MLNVVDEGNDKHSSKNNMKKKQLRIKKGQHKEPSMTSSMKCRSATIEKKEVWRKRGDERTSKRERTN